MTDMNAPGAKAAPGFGAFIGSDENDNQTDRENPGSGRGKPASNSEEGVAEKGDTATKPRRRRGSRGGRRRSGGSTSKGDPRSDAKADSSDSKGDSRKAKKAEGEKAVEAETSADEPKSSTTRSRRKRSTRRATRREAGTENAEEASTDSSDSTELGDEPRRSTRRTSRSRRSTRKTSAVKEAVTEQDPDSAPSGREPEDEAEAPASAGRSEPRTRRKRAVRRRKKAATEETETTAPEEPLSEDSPEDSSESPARKTGRRRGTRGGRKRRKTGASPTRKVAAAVFEVIPGEEDDLPSLPELPDETEMLDETEEGVAPARTSRKKKTTKATRKKRSRKKPASGEDEEEVVKTTRRKKSDVVPDQQILVNACDREEVRVAVVRDGTILDFQMNVEKDKSLVGDIYRGRVVNLEASIGAAFIDFGRGRNGFLHTSDVLPAYGEAGWSLSKLLQVAVDPDDLDEDSSSLMADELDFEESGDGAGEDGDADASEKSEKQTRKKTRKKKAARRRFRPRRPIKEVLKVGDKVVVQVTKDAIGDKGPTLTTYLSIPGRYLVLTPSMTHRGVSRKIEDLKERRRLRRILDALNVSEGMGVIARTAASGQTKVELKRDLDYLLGAWRRFSKRLDSGHGPMTLYQESDVAIRTVRDLYGPRTEAVVVDDRDAYRKIIEFAELLMPDQVERFKLHDEPRPLFHQFGVEQDFERIFTRRIELPSGGSIVFDQAEALVAIDVNSGKTRTASFDFEEIALKTNMDAVPEIARQIRLRDLGGILVVDFIDMMKMANRRTVERAFRDELVGDRARSKVGRISQFGLLEMTRQRLGPGMSKKLFTNCPTCRGMGKLRTSPSRAAAILRRLGSALTLKGFSTIEIRAHRDVLDYLKKEHGAELKKLEEQHNRKLLLTAVPDQVEDSVLRYLRADGREVRPGGRRKR